MTDIKKKKTDYENEPDSALDENFADIKKIVSSHLDEAKMKTKDEIIAKGFSEKEKPGPMMEEVLKALPIAWENIIKKSFSKDTIVTFLICALIVISGKCLNLVRVVGDSMNPTYTNGNLLTTRKNDVQDNSDINYYDVVVCCFDKDSETANALGGNMIIKRVVGVPGDTIQIIDGILHRNGEAVVEDFEKMVDQGVAEKTITLEENEFFVLGDNRNNSYDSRYIGPVTETEVTNIVKFRVLN